MRLYGSLVLTCVALLAGCIGATPLAPVTAANQDQVKSCQNTASIHNGLVIGDLSLGVAGTTLGAVGAIETDVSAKNALAVTAAVVAGVAAVGAGGVALSASSFANGNCSQWVGPLPVLAKDSP